MNPGETIMKFNPCQGKEKCTEGGTHCQGCGRSHEEIGRTRELIGVIAGFAQEMKYESYQEFAAFVGDKVAKKGRLRAGATPSWRVGNTDRSLSLGMQRDFR